VRLTKPVEFVKSDKQEIDSWTMGYILGNGSSKNYNLIISVGSHDFEEILSKIDQDVIMSYRCKPDGVYDISVNKEHRKFYNLLDLHNVKSIAKWIPDEYKHGAIVQRKALLAGLLDSDGTCANNKLRFSSSSKKLIDDVAWLVRSLGGIASISFNNREDRKNIEYSLQIRTPFNPFSLKRKADQYKVLPTDICANKRIVKAEYIGIQTGKCISVDSEKNLYLTRDFTVTHNTYIAASYAAQMLEEGNIDTIVMTRPNVEAGRGFGFLKGELEEKFAPYIEPLLDVLNERLGKSHTEYLVKRGAIQFKPLEFLRGKTFSNCLYILDEAQNTTPSQMKLFLSRIGEDTKVIIDGDIEQKDINGICGLEDAVNRLRNIDNIGIVEFAVDDVVRSGICKEILLAYRN
jgi:phosphate starvation-inducible PhoH-like protein